MPISPIPKIMLPKLTDIHEDMLRSLGIKLLMLDFDNTILPYVSDEPTEEMLAWLEHMNHLPDIQICVVSNSHNGRVPVISRELGLKCITHARKPFSKGIKQCLREYGIPAAQAALVGDQIYTDVLGANNVGVLSILVDAINNHNIWLKGRHVLELPFIAMARRIKK